MSEPNWITLARTELGQHEINGPRSNPEIVKLFRDAGHPEISSEDTAWCAAFCGAMLKRAGYRPSGSLMARSYLTWGTSLLQPQIGAIAVLWRNSPDSSEGHVGFVVESGKDYIKLLGGNQGALGQVSVETFPLSRVLGFRWPILPVEDEPKEALKPEATKSRSIGEKIMTDISALEDLIPTIELYAPTVGQLLGGPVGGIGGQLAALGIHVLATSFGVEPTPEAIASHMNTQPMPKVAGGLTNAEDMASKSLPTSQDVTADPLTLQEETVKVFHDAGVTNPTAIMIGSFVVTALSGWLVNKGWVSNDISISAVGFIGGAVSMASSIYHSYASNTNTKALASTK
jgi:uncharacterized protein (TIGR02594 family)